jgi:hypothetical protein
MGNKRSRAIKHLNNLERIWIRKQDEMFDRRPKMTLEEYHDYVMECIAGPDEQRQGCLCLGYCVMGECNCGGYQPTSYRNNANQQT